MSPTKRSSLPRRCAVAAAVAVAALVLPAASASAEPAPEPVPLLAESELTLSIIPDEPDSWNPRSIVALDCGPAGGNHPDPLLACEELTVVGGDFEQLARPATCSAEWDPVTITATGYWEGRSIDFTDTYTNRHCAENVTGGVFRF